MNSSCTEMVACLRQTASSYDYMLARWFMRYGGSWWACFYRWNCEEHDDELLFAQHWVADEGVGESDETAAALLNEVTISCDVVAIDCHSFGREQRQLPEGVAFVQAFEQPDEIGIPTNDFGVAPHGGDFVVAVLEEEHALFLLEHGDCNDLVDAFGESGTWCSGSARIVCAFAAEAFT